MREGKLRQVPIPIISLGERPGEAADDDPADAPEEQISYRGYSALLHLAVSEGGPPHQVLVYFFVRTLGVPPRGIVAELSDLTLRDLLRDCEDRYGKRSLLPAEVLAADFAPLREALELPVKKVITEPRTLETIPQLHEVVVGDTHLRDYFARNPDTSVTSWWHSARRRVDKALQRRLQAAQPGDPLLEVQGLLATLRPIARDEET